MAAGCHGIVFSHAGVFSCHSQFVANVPRQWFRHRFGTDRGGGRSGQFRGCMFPMPQSLPYGTVSITQLLHKILVGDRALVVPLFQFAVPPQFLFPVFRLFLLFKHCKGIDSCVLFCFCHRLYFRRQFHFDFLTPFVVPNFIFRITVFRVFWVHHNTSIFQLHANLH